MLITTLAFLALSALFMWLHLRAGHKSAPAPTTVPCPRCRAAVPKAAQFCPGCGAPMQAYEMVTAKVVADGAEAGGGGDGPKHAIVRADMCVGCGTCVAACPEPA